MDSQNQQMNQPIQSQPMDQNTSDVNPVVNKTKPTIPLLIILLILIVGVVAFRAGKGSDKPKQLITPTIIMDSVTPTYTLTPQASNWQTYTLSDWWSFSIQYPQKWHINKVDAGPIFVYFSKNPEENTADFINIKIYRNSDVNELTVDEIKQGYLNSGERIFSGDISANGKTGSRFDLKNRNERDVVLFEKINNNIPVLIYYMNVEYSLNNKEEALQIFDHMISTFKTN